MSVGDNDVKVPTESLRWSHDVLHTRYVADLRRLKEAYMAPYSAFVLDRYL